MILNFCSLSQHGLGAALAQDAGMFMGDGDGDGDGDDDDGFDEVDSYGDQLISQPLRKVKTEFVNYAKRAKKVDVKKLKENLWHEMTHPEDTATFGQKRKKDWVSRRRSEVMIIPQHMSHGHLI